MLVGQVHTGSLTSFAFKPINLTKGRGEDTLQTKFERRGPLDEAGTGTFTGVKVHVLTWPPRWVRKIGWTSGRVPRHAQLAYALAALSVAAIHPSAY